MRLHGRIAKALEPLAGARVERFVAPLAHRFMESSLLDHTQAEKAAHYCKRAAERAERESAWEEAARHYEDCLSVVRED